MDVMRPYFAIFMAIVLVSCASQSTDLDKTAEEKKADIYYAQGSQDLKDRKYTEALDNLIKASELAPKDSLIQNNLGMAYYFKGQKQQAEDHLKKSIELDEKNSDAKNNLASLYYTQGKMAQAKELYLQVEKDLVYRHQYRIKYNLALLALKENQTDLAMQYLQDSVQENRDYCPAFYLMGKLETQRDNDYKAIEHFKAASSGPCVSEAAALFALAKTLEKIGDFDQARRKYLEVQARFIEGPYTSMAIKQLKILDDEEKRADNSANEKWQGEQNDLNKPMKAPQF